MCSLKVNYSSRFFIKKPVFEKRVYFSKITGFNILSLYSLFNDERFKFIFENISVVCGPMESFNSTQIV